MFVAINRETGEWEETHECEAYLRLHHPECNVQEIAEYKPHKDPNFRIEDWIIEEED